MPDNICASTSSKLIYFFAAFGGSGLGAAGGASRLAQRAGFGASGFSSQNKHTR